MTSNKTFFVYGGADRERKSILHMVSYYDHNTGTVPRPAILLDKKTRDAHDNPTLQIDAEGHLWIFSNAHGTARPSYIHQRQQGATHISDRPPGRIANAGWVPYDG